MTQSMKSLSSSKSTRSPATYCFTNDVSKSLCWPGMEANFHHKHSLNENNHLEFLFHNAEDRTRQSHSHVISSSAHRIQRRAFKEQETTNPKHMKRAFCHFYLQCGLIAFGYHAVTAGGRRSGVTFLPSR